ncbi:MAG: hypothetical protein CM1200mP24_05470 [Gammaproteobacteria bacterium]|nr:MAG: hypothetical protein CM1200mP24_05470 [Gammaproteobacteria bacterium]
MAQGAEGFTGLIVYAGDGHVVTPLPDDVGTVNNLLTALHPGMMPIHGSKPQSAVEWLENCLLIRISTRTNPF